MSRPSNRPPAEKRLFTSPVIEDLIRETRDKIADPELAWLFENCFPNTLDTTVTFTPDDGSGNPDTFIITGDIDALWLRDSTNQVWPYIPYAKHCPKLKSLLHGLIRRQAQCVLLDPYANAFYRTPDKESHWKSDQTDIKPGVHERKYELDSLASVLRLATGYYDATGDPTPFDDTFFKSVNLILQTIRNEQAGTPEQVHPAYSFARHTSIATDTLPGGGHGNPCRRTGMSRSPFRPSDDATIFQYHIPSNAMASVMLRKTAEMVKALQATTMASAVELDLLSMELKIGIDDHGTIDHPKYGQILAYEINGFGSYHVMDDANVPNLLSFPYLGYCPPNDEVYCNTRRFCLSPDNPYFHRGTAATGIGSPHVGLGWIWPLSLITQAITSTDESEILQCLRTLKSTHAGTGFMHEVFWMNDPTRFTRPWFAWANTFFGELILQVLATRAELLKRPIV
jgi:uncharacterized protein